jgi:4-hydroxy-3-methylbut-2-en-1-yl diphosphate synthase IspG/GcpE
MPLYSVQLKVAANPETLSLLGDALSPTLFDGQEPIPDPLALPISELRVDSMDKIFQLMQSDEEINVRRFVLDLRALHSLFTRVVVYLAPILYRWSGEEFVVILPEQGELKYLLPSLGDLLRSLELRSRGIRLISCPTCARCRTDFPSMVRSIEDRLGRIDKPLDVAIMGCEVNGPGEARAADVGIAFGDQKGMLFKNGEKVRVVSIEEAADVLLAEIDKI